MWLYGKNLLSNERENMNRKSFDAEHHFAYRTCQHEGWKPADRAKIARDVARRRAMLAFAPVSESELAEIERIENSLLPDCRCRRR